MAKVSAAEREATILALVRSASTAGISKDAICQIIGLSSSKVTKYLTGLGYAGMIFKSKPGGLGLVWLADPVDLKTRAERQRERRQQLAESSGYLAGDNPRRTWISAAGAPPVKTKAAPSVWQWGAQ